VVKGERDLLERVRTEIESRGLIRPGEKVLVALSGGPDSSVLLHLLWRLSREQGWQLQLACAHLHHGLRGAEADADLERSRALAVSLEIPFYSRRVDVARLAREEGLTLEAAGRLARYHFLDELADSLGVQRIALGHHLDDQAETVLLHVLQGTGLRGLAGMRWIRAGRYVRPLLSVSRTEIEAYIAAWGWKPARDETNADVSLLRNRIRHRLLPVLEREFSPAIRVNLARLAEVVREEDDFLDDLVRSKWAALEAEVLQVNGAPRISWSLEGYAAQPAAVQRRLLRQFVEAVAGHNPPRDLGFTRTEGWRQELLGLARQQVVSPRPLAGPSAGPFSLPGGLAYWVGNGRIVLTRAAVRTAPSNAAPAAAAGTALTATGRDVATGQAEAASRGIRLLIPGEVSWWAGAETKLWAFWADTGPSRADEAVTVDSGPSPKYSVCVDADEIVGALQLRGRRPGDRIAPPGLSGSKKLQDLFVDRKIPRGWRQYWPIVVDSKGIVWVPGLAVDRRVLTKSTTRQRVCLAWSGPAWPEQARETGLVQ